MNKEEQFPEIPRLSRGVFLTGDVPICLKCKRDTDVEYIWIPKPSGYECCIEVNNNGYFERYTTTSATPTPTCDKCNQELDLLKLYCISCDHSIDDDGECTDGCYMRCVGEYAEDDDDRLCQCGHFANAGRCSNCGYGVCATCIQRDTVTTTGEFSIRHWSCER